MFHHVDSNSAGNSAYCPESENHHNIGSQKNKKHGMTCVTVYYGTTTQCMSVIGRLVVRQNCHKVRICHTLYTQLIMF